MCKTERIAKHVARCGAVLAISAALVAGIEPTTAGSAGKESGAADITTLDLDGDGADIVPGDETNPGRGVDPTTLLIDRDGADIAEGDWWGTSDYAGVPDNSSVSPVMTRYDLMLFLERNIWEVEPDDTSTEAVGIHRDEHFDDGLD